MSNSIRKKALLAIFLTSIVFFINIEIGFIFLNLISRHLCIWAIWCGLSLSILLYMFFKLENISVKKGR